MIRNLASGEARYIIGLLIAARGVGYIPVVFADPSTYTTSYQVQADIMPVWVYCVVQLAIGLGLIISAKVDIRLSAIGRTISVLAFAMSVLFFVIWIQSLAWTAVSTYAVMIAATLAQTVYIPPVG